MKRPPPATGPADPAQRPPTLVHCGDEELVDITSDPDHCGGCYQACSTQLCVDGACTAQPFGR